MPERFTSLAAGTLSRTAERVDRARRAWWVRSVTLRCCGGCGVYAQGAENDRDRATMIGINAISRN
jgi:hypothetical protein